MPLGALLILLYGTTELSSCNRHQIARQAQKERVWSPILHSQQISVIANGTEYNAHSC